MEDNKQLDQEQNGAAEAPKTFTQEEVDKMLQAEADRRVSSALAKKEKETQRKIAEAERLAKLSDEDRFQAELDTRERALAEKERELTLSQNRVSALQVMEKSGVPASLVEFVLHEEADTMMSNIKTLKSEIDKAVQMQVASKIGSGAPGKADVNGKLSKETFAKLSISEKAKIYSTNPELYEELSKK